MYTIKVVFTFFTIGNHRSTDDYIFGFIKCMHAQSMRIFFDRSNMISSCNISLNACVVDVLRKADLRFAACLFIGVHAQQNPDPINAIPSSANRKLDSSAKNVAAVVFSVYTFLEPPDFLPTPWILFIQAQTSVFPGKHGSPDLTEWTAGTFS